MTAQPDKFEIRVSVTDGVGQLDWDGATTKETLLEAISLASDDVMLDKGVRRMEASIAAGDLTARWALHHAGFRREGIRREAYAMGDGFVDVWVYARLASDVVYGPESFSGVMDSVLPTKRVLAHVLYRNARGQMLLCQTSYKDEWEFPGGVVESDESPREGAAREVAEELGVELAVGGLLCVDWLPRHLGWSDAMQLVFDGGALTDEQIASLRFADGEITALHWVDAAEASAHVYPGWAARIRAIQAATHYPIYLEAGQDLRSSEI